MIFYSLFQKHSVDTQRGFTLIELLVTISIVVLVTAIILIQYSSFNSSTLLTSQAYVTAFDLREAQSLAIGVRGVGTIFSEEYGLYFDLSKPGHYLLFHDNGATFPAHYDAGEEIGVPNILDPRFNLSNICVYIGSIQNCNIARLSVTFKRPNFDAVFSAYNNGGTLIHNITAAEIMISPFNGTGQRTVSVSNTGQITVIDH